MGPVTTPRVQLNVLPADYDVMAMRLDEALAQDACPICALVADSVKRFIDGLLYEQVADGILREELVRAQGFCYRHGGQVCAAEAGWTKGTGVAAIYLDLTERVIRTLEINESPHLVNLSWWCKALGRKATPTGNGLDAIEPLAPCPICKIEVEAEQRYVARLVERVRDEDFREKYLASHGLCLPHLRHSLQHCVDAKSQLFLATTAREKLVRLIHDVREYNRKHSWVYRDEPKLPEEQNSPFRSVAFEVGEQE